MVAPRNRVGERTCLYTSGMNRRDYTAQAPGRTAPEGLRARVRQQEATGWLGLAALSGMSLPDLMDEAVNLVTGVLEVEYCKILELVAEGTALQSTYRLDPSRPHGTARVFRTGAPESISELDEDVLEDIAVGDPEQLDVLRRIDSGSYMCVPLRIGGHALGAMGFISARSGRHYGAEDVAVAEGLAHCAALALDNASHKASEVELVRELVRRAREEQRVISLPRKGAPQITPRQMEILELLSSGHSTREIGRELYLSEATVRNHIRGRYQQSAASDQQEQKADGAGFWKDNLPETTIIQMTRRPATSPSGRRLQFRPLGGVPRSRADRPGGRNPRVSRPPRCDAKRRLPCAAS